MVLRKGIPNIKKWEESDHWVEIDLDRCVGADECVEIYPVEVYGLINGNLIAEN
ncbi:hypothetical protein ES703_46133 [subsurface metagenome]